MNMTDEIIYRELPIEFYGTGDVKGTIFTQIDKSAKAYLYKRIGEYGEVHYEVFNIKKSKGGEYIIDGNNIKIEPHVMYPKTNHFGIWAWCYTELNKAIDKFIELTNNTTNEVK